MAETTRKLTATIIKTSNLYIETVKTVSLQSTTVKNPGLYADIKKI